METALGTTPKDILFLLALELDLPSIIQFCKTNKHINSKICSNKEFWFKKLNRDFLNNVDNWKEFKEYFKLDKSYRDMYKLLHGLNILQRKLNLDYSIKELYETKSLNLSNGEKLIDIPKEIGILSNLQELYLSDNSLTEIPKQIGNLLNLRTLYLTNNLLKSLPKELKKLSKLERLYLESNSFTELPKEIESLPNLQRLYLELNPLISLPKDIGKFPNLQKLYLDESQVKLLPVKFPKSKLIIF